MPIPKEENWFAKEHSLIDHFVVLYSGNMGRCHDTDTLFEAALKLKDKPILFVCIGGGAKRSALNLYSRILRQQAICPWSVLPLGWTI